jgi:putative transposase
MVSPAQRRDAMRWAQAAYQVSERRACRALVVERSVLRYQSCRDPDLALRGRLRELAQARPAFGHKRLHVLIRRDGWAVNHKKTHRLYKAEGLQLKPRRPRRRRAVTMRQGDPVVLAPNTRWAMDFMHDTLADRSPIRIFTLVDVCTRECVALHVARSFSGTDVAAFLAQAGQRRGKLPAVVQCDQGTEFTAIALDHWAYWNQVQLDFSRPGKPVDNCVCEAFNGSLRRECLSQHWFASIAEADVVLQAWQHDYNIHRPHTTLGLQSPAAYRRAGIFEPRFIRAQNSQ